MLQATNTIENGNVLLKCKISKLGFLRLELGIAISTYASSGAAIFALQTQLQVLADFASLDLELL